MLSLGLNGGILGLIYTLLWGKLANNNWMDYVSRKTFISLALRAAVIDLNLQQQ